MLNEWSDREPDPTPPSAADYIVRVIVIGGMLTFLFNLVRMIWPG